MKSTRYIAAIIFLTGFLSVSYSQTVDDIIDKYVSAIGGLDKINSALTVKITRKISVRGTDVPETIIIKRPEKVRIEQTQQGQTSINAYDGSTGWVINPFRGSKDVDKLNQEQSKRMKNIAEFEGKLINYKEKGYTVELLGKDEFEGTDIYKIKLTDKDGEVFIYYIDANLYLILKETSKRKIKEKEITNETVYGDYYSEDGCMMPHSLEMKSSTGRGNSQKVTIEKVEFNVPVDDNIFVMPDSQPK